VATPTGTSHPDSGLTLGTTYRYRVRAADAVRNFSGYSNIATATTAISDTTAPTMSSMTPANGATGVAVVATGRGVIACVVANRGRHRTGRIPQLEGRGVDRRLIHGLAEDRRDDEIGAAVTKTLASGEYVLGSEVSAFEEEFAGYVGARFAIGVNSGTSALHLALLAAGVGPGNEVIAVSCTFIATVAAIDYTGARPVFVDVDPETLNMDVTQVEAALTERTKALLPVHLHGHPADLDPILDIARRNNLVVIEDAAQAHGAEYKGRRVGGIGDLGCFSFILERISAATAKPAWW
jgi:hypothetical protein